MLEVMDAKYIEGYRLWIKFNNGKSGEIDLKDQLWGPAFEPLKDIAKFRKFSLCNELDTITWENEVDFAPEFLFEKVVSESDVLK
jgi:hypothetical protein